MKDVWGDAVNTASRMESNGHPGGVHISSETYRNIKHLDYLHAQCCGEVLIKGKGLMTTYVVTKMDLYSDDEIIDHENIVSIGYNFYVSSKLDKIMF